MTTTMIDSHFHDVLVVLAGTSGKEVRATEFLGRIFVGTSEVSRARVLTIVRTGPGR